MPSKADRFSTELTDVAAQAQVLAHPARLKILQVLADHGRCICGDIVEALPLAQATVSRHLKALRDAGLVSLTQDGPRSCYCLRVEALEQSASEFASFFGSILPESSDAEPSAPEPAPCSSQSS
jgi:ArsR family transcriptional regulator